jgi:hypothetical protein
LTYTTDIFLRAGGRFETHRGVGPALLLPTATDDNLGSGKWCAGPSVAALVQPRHFTIGALVSNFWSFAGSSSRADVYTMSLQYFLNYNLEQGWFLTGAPILSANWNAGSGKVWLVPGRWVWSNSGAWPSARNGSVPAYYNLVRPDTVPPTRQLRVQLALLFPRMPKPKK